MLNETDTHTKPTVEAAPSETSASDEYQEANQDMLRASATSQAHDASLTDVSELWTSHSLSAFLSSLSARQLQTVQRLKQYAELPPDPSKCLCRVYLGARQCSRMPFQDTGFCKNHQRVTTRIKNGIQGNPLSDKELYSRIVAKFRQKCQKEYKWYSRIGL